LFAFQICPAQQPSLRVHAFYYPWYGNPVTDGRYANWNHPVAVRKGPPRQFPGGDDIGADFYPKLGCYSSNSPEILEQHMRWLRRARVGVICVSWWGRDSFTDRALTPLFRAAEKHGIRITFHIEPHIGLGGRNAESMRDAMRYLLDRFGKSPALFRDPDRGNRPMIYVYDSYLTKAEEWATILSPDGEHTIRGTSHDVIAIGLWVKKNEKDFMLRSGFDGFYTYFATEGFTYGSTPANWKRLARWAEDQGKVFIPCVGPGYIDTRIRPWNGKNTRARESGKYYDDMFRTAISVQPPFVGITSFNEWHEGTQIEPAIPKKIDGYTYESFSPLLPEHYLDRTAEWARKLE
jgi:glycoprotein endo-alpha-1,2-mannosidase